VLISDTYVLRSSTSTHRYDGRSPSGSRNCSVAILAMIFALFPICTLICFTQTIVDSTPAADTALQLVSQSSSVSLSQCLQIGERCHLQKDYPCAIKYYQVMIWW
jgi:hypothetical protein